MSGQARALTPERVRELLEGITPGEWESGIDDLATAQHRSVIADITGQPQQGTIYAVWAGDGTFVAGTGTDRNYGGAVAQLIAAAPDLARRVLELEAQNAALSAENSRLAAREREFAVLMGVGDGGQYRADWEARAASIAGMAAELARAQAGAQAGEILREYAVWARDSFQREAADTLAYDSWRAAMTCAADRMTDLLLIVEGKAALAQASAEGAGAGEVAG